MTPSPLTVPEHGCCLPHPQDGSIAWCGSGRPATAFVDAVDCLACQLLEGFRSENPARAAAEEALAARLRLEPAPAATVSQAHLHSSDLLRLAWAPTREQIAKMTSALGWPHPGTVAQRGLKGGVKLRPYRNGWKAATPHAVAPHRDWTALEMLGLSERVEPDCWSVTPTGLEVTAIRLYAIARARLLRMRAGR